MTDEMKKKEAEKKAKKKVNIKKIGTIISAIVVFAILVIGVPLIINHCYKCDIPIITTKWDAKDVLSYYGAVLAACGTGIGVYVSIKAAYKNYQNDARVRVLPFIAVTPFDRMVDADRFLRYVDRKEDEIQEESCTSGYIEYKLEQIYFIITSCGIEIKKGLDKYQQQILRHAGAIWKPIAPDEESLDYIDYFSVPLEIENVGNGTAVNLRIGFNYRSDDPHLHGFVYPMMLKQNQTRYIHIFSIAEPDIVKGEYTLEFFYEDIYGNKYFQEFPILLEIDDNGMNFHSINLLGKQMKLKEGEPYADT